MNYKLIQKSLGRKPNNLEKLFLEKFWKSYQNQNCFNSEVKQAEVQTILEPKMTVVAQGKSDLRNIVSENIIFSSNGKKIATVSSDKGSFVIGSSTANPRKHSDKVKHIFILCGSKKKTMIQNLYQQEWFEASIPVHKGGLGYSIYQLLKRNKCGLQMPFSIKEKLSILSRKGTHGLLILIENRGFDLLQVLLKKYSAKAIYLGSLTPSVNIEIKSGGKSFAHIPFPTLDMLVNDKQNHEEIKLQKIIPDFPHPKLKGKKNYNNELVKLIEDYRSTDQINSLQNKKSLNGNIGIFKKGRVKYGVAIDDNAYLNYNDYKMKAIAAISNITRQLVCSGIRPEVCSGFLQISKNNKREKNSFLKGIHDAGKFLNLNIDHLSFEISEDLPDGKFIAAGTYTRDELIQNTFGTKDLFISILGSHRGELGGSRYLYLLNQENKGYRPVVDLLMESRLQEAVLTGINEDLIQSARPIGRGGVALAIAKSFEKNSNLGARIYFSRKLKTEELLFGETQGLVLVTIKENDLMEFERICMAIGVPATTIGRVTDDGFYTFNKSIKLPVKKLN